uniref:Proton-coupled amino acid transporter 4 n=1 Tax=Cacopsylla melanoneura TaxID=428564 RepID=A0A8D8QK37_9HEMI
MTRAQIHVDHQANEGYDNPTLQVDIPTYKESTNTASKAKSKESQSNIYVVSLSQEKGGDEDPYDPYQHRDVKHPTTYWDTLLHMMKASLGTGILAMPNAFQHSGYLVGTVGTLLIGFLCTYSMHMLVKCHYELCRRKKVPSLSYPGIAEAAFEEGPERTRWLAPIAQPISNAFLIVYQIGTSCIYIVFIASNIKAVCDMYVGDHTVQTYMGYIFIPLVLICWVRNLKLLAPFSTLANIVTILSFVITFYYVFSDVPSIEERHAVGEIKGLPLFFGTVLFAMEAIGVIMPLENEMKKPKKFSSTLGVLNSSMIPITIMYALVGFFGYIKYGEGTRGSITLNLPNDEKLAQSVKIMLAVAMYATYALSQYVAFDLIWTIVEPKLEKTKNKMTYEYTIRTGIVIVTFILAAAIPNLELFISLIGALCLATMGIALPAIIQMLTFWDSMYGMQKVIFVLKNLCMILIAIMGFVIGVTTSVTEKMATVHPSPFFSANSR